MSEPKKKILLIDDEEVILEVTKWAFEAQGYEVFAASNGEEGMKIFQTSQPDLLLIDYKLPGMTGVEFLKKAKAIQSDVCAIMITGLTHASEDIEKECQELGAIAFLHKPLQTEKVLEIVREALQNRTKSSA